MRTHLGKKELPVYPPRGAARGALYRWFDDVVYVARSDDTPAQIAALFGDENWWIGEKSFYKDNL